MNHLAHIYLSCQDENLLLGNFMADFMTPKEIRSLPSRLIRGIELHRSIDQFTDQHADVKKCVALFRPTQKKYSPVVVDILFDYFLIKNWSLFSNEPFGVFKERIYRMLVLHTEFFPEKLKTFLPKMIDDDFLMSCSNEERLNKTFERLNKRAQFSNSFDSVTNDLKIHHTALEGYFLSFFPDLVKHVQPFCDCK